MGVLAFLPGIVFFFSLKTLHLKGVAVSLRLMEILLILVGCIPYRQNNELRVERVYGFNMNPSLLKSKELPLVQLYLSFASLQHSVGFVLVVLGFGIYVYLQLKKITSNGKLQHCALVLWPLLWLGSHI